MNEEMIKIRFETFVETEKLPKAFVEDAQEYDNKNLNLEALEDDVRKILVDNLIKRVDYTDIEIYSAKEGGYNSLIDIADTCALEYDIITEDELSFVFGNDISRTLFKSAMENHKDEISLGTGYFEPNEEDPYGYGISYLYALDDTDFAYGGTLKLPLREFCETVDVLKETGVDYIRNNGKEYKPHFEDTPVEAFESEFIHFMDFIKTDYIGNIQQNRNNEER